jgi:sugar O-acyltransferase (sialic acid O-acetyltransferase NeuD family)
MVIIGAKGHAKEILDIIHLQDKPFCFFDDVSTDLPEKLYGKYKILRTKEEVLDWFKNDKRFVLGTGNCKLRFEMAEKFIGWNGELTSVVSGNSIIGSFGVDLHPGLNIMHQVVIYNDVRVGEGSLINTAASLHHDVKIGRYCEISPAARILGGVEIGDFCTVGSGAIILPKVKIGNNAIIGAGAVVNKNVPDNITVAGIPAIPLVK